MRSKSLVLLALGLGVLLYAFLRDPADGNFLPCPFNRLTGWLCPGCGSQRALHDLLHGRFGEAWSHNALLIIALVAAGSVWIIGRVSPSVQAMATCRATWWVCLVAVVVWGIMRNVY